MKETLHCSNGQDETRVRRAFKWVVTFRDFPVNSWQFTDYEMLVNGSLTLFTKGRAEFWLGGERREDRLPGVLSTERVVPVSDELFKLVYVEPTTRVCIPAKINQGKLPTVSKIVLGEGERVDLDGNYLICLGTMTVNDRVFKEESTFSTSEPRTGVALEPVILLKFHDSR